jgi:hypothetical protein
VLRIPSTGVRNAFLRAIDKLQATPNHRHVFVSILILMATCAKFGANNH